MIRFGNRAALADLPIEKIMLSLPGTQTGTILRPVQVTFLLQFPITCRILRENP